MRPKTSTKTASDIFFQPTHAYEMRQGTFRAFCPEVSGTLFANLTTKGFLSPRYCSARVCLLYVRTSICCFLMALRHWVAYHPGLRRFVGILYPICTSEEAFVFSLRRNPAGLGECLLAALPTKTPCVKPDGTALTTRRRNTPKRSISYSDRKNYFFFLSAAMISSIFGTAIFRAALRSAFISKPHFSHLNVAWSGRFSSAIWPHLEQRWLVNCGLI